MYGPPAGDPQMMEARRQAAMRRGAGAAGGAAPGLAQAGTSGAVGQALGTPPPGRPMAGRLGLGLGLNRAQRGGFLEAAQAGGAQDYLAARPQLQQRIENRIQAGSPREAALQNFMATGATPTGAEVRSPQRGLAEVGRGSSGDTAVDQARLQAQAQGAWAGARPVPGRAQGPANLAGARPMPRPGGYQPLPGGPRAPGPARPMQRPQPAPRAARRPVQRGQRR
jgi:hypothetical protein